jgi:hypothetical protein
MDNLGIKIWGDRLFTTGIYHLVHTVSQKLWCLRCLNFKVKLPYNWFYHKHIHTFNNVKTIMLIMCNAISNTDNVEYH